jgi:hypothetical protein
MLTSQFPAYGHCAVSLMYFNSTVRSHKKKTSKPTLFAGCVSGTHQRQKSYVQPHQDCKKLKLNGTSEKTAKQKTDTSQYHQAHTKKKQQQPLSTTALICNVCGDLWCADVRWPDTHDTWHEPVQTRVCIRTAICHKIGFMLLPSARSSGMS